MYLDVRFFAWLFEGQDWTDFQGWSGDEIYMWRMVYIEGFTSTSPPLVDRNWHSYWFRMLWLRRTGFSNKNWTRDDGVWVVNLMMFDVISIHKSWDLAGCWTFGYWAWRQSKHVRPRMHLQVSTLLGMTNTTLIYVDQYICPFFSQMANETINCSCFRKWFEENPTVNFLFAKLPSLSWPGIVTTAKHFCLRRLPVQVLPSFLDSWANWGAQHGTVNLKDLRRSESDWFDLIWSDLIWFDLIIRKPSSSIVRWGCWQAHRLCWRSIVCLRG